VRLATIDRDWPQLRLLVYSPSISAGVSFRTLALPLPHPSLTPPHPGVDIAVQQIYRVLGSSTTMNIFVIVAPRRPAGDGLRIGEMLTDLGLFKRFVTRPSPTRFPTSITDDRVCCTTPSASATSSSSASCSA
jgi:hypothetical protein